MVSSACPTKQLTKRSIVTYNVQVPKAVCTTPYACKQSQYELNRIIPPVGTLDRNITLCKMLTKMAFVKHLEEQGKTTEGSNLLVDELYPKSVIKAFCIGLEWFSNDRH